MMRTATLLAAAGLLLCQFEQSAAHTWQTDAHADDQDVTLQCKSASVDHSKTVVAAVGDSITVGATCRTWRGGFVKVMQDVLGEEKYDVRDCGLCGHDAVRANHGNKKHATYWNTSAMAESKAMKPDYVVFMLGTNDADEWYNTSKYFSQDFLDLVTYCECRSAPSASAAT
jgi:lysophospholipase L1-like esterase